MCSFLEQDIHSLCLKANSVVQACESGTPRPSNHKMQSTPFGFCLQVFRLAAPPQRVDLETPMGNKRSVSFPRT